MLMEQYTKDASFTTSDDYVNSMSIQYNPTTTKVDIHLFQHDLEY